MALVSSLLDLSAGNLQVQSTIGQGSFQFWTVNVGHKRLEHWEGIKWKCMHVREREGEREGARERESSACVSEVSALKEAEYSTWWQWVPEHYPTSPPRIHFHPPTFPPEAALGLPSARGISWSRYSRFFLWWVTDPLKPFHAVSHWLTHLFSRAICNSLSLLPVEGHIAISEWLSPHRIY